MKRRLYKEKIIQLQKEKIREKKSYIEKRQNKK